MIFKDTRGETLPDFADLPGIDTDDIDAWLDRQFFDRSIDANTCTAKWEAGNTIDWHLAVGHLFPSVDASRRAG